MVNFDQQKNGCSLINDKIVRCGSVMFFAYKRPFRAIASALSRLARRGEVPLLVKGAEVSVSRRVRQRLWQKVDFALNGNDGDKRRVGLAEMQGAAGCRQDIELGDSAGWEKPGRRK